MKEIKVICIGCGKTIKKQEDYSNLVELFTCQKCFDRKIDFSNASLGIVEDGETLWMTRKCKSCRNTCKIFTISKKAILNCPKRKLKKESNDECNNSEGHFDQ